MNPPSQVRVILASSSPGRRNILQRAGIEPEIIAPDIDESSVRVSVAEGSHPAVVGAVASAKVAAVEAHLLASAGREAAHDIVIVGCDSMLELDGDLLGKPITKAEAVERLGQLSGRKATVLTGHQVVVLRSELHRTLRQETQAVSSTHLEFAALGAAEIDAYVATDEPLRIAGCAVSGIGGAFIDSVQGDPHGIDGLSLPLLRHLVAELGIDWQRLWNRDSWIVSAG